MADYVDRDKVLYYVEPDARPFLAERIRNIPAADVVPVVRGRWEWNSDNGYYYCSNCNAVSPREDQEGEYCDTPAFCHVCGADMRDMREVVDGN